MARDEAQTQLEATLRQARSDVRTAFEEVKRADASLAAARDAAEARPERARAREHRLSRGPVDEHRGHRRGAHGARRGDRGGGGGGRSEAGAGGSPRRDGAFSLKRAAPLLLAAALGAWWTRLLIGALVAPVDDADVWWVAAAGRRMLATGDVPTTNGFSFAEPEHAWVMHEWLFGPPYAWGLDRARSEVLRARRGRRLRADGRARRLGDGGARAPSRGGVRRWRSSRLVLFAHPSARPTWVALAFPVGDGAPRLPRDLRARRGVRRASCSSSLWANAHGSFPLGRRAARRAATWAECVDRRRRIVTTLAAAAVTLVNPYGLRLHALVVDYVVASAGRGVGNLTPIVEYAPLWDARYFAVTSVAAALALGGLVLLAVWALRDAAHRARAAVVLALAPLAIAHARVRADRGRRRRHRAPARARRRGGRLAAGSVRRRAVAPRSRERRRIRRCPRRESPLSLSPRSLGARGRVARPRPGRPELPPPRRRAPGRREGRHPVPVGRARPLEDGAPRRPRLLRLAQRPLLAGDAPPRPDAPRSPARARS